MPNFHPGSHLFQRKSMLVWLSLALLAGAVLATMLGGSSNSARAQNEGLPPVVISNPIEVNIASATVVWIYGANLEPGTEISLLLRDKSGVYTDVTALAFGQEDGSLVVNDDGAFAIRWQVAQWSNENVGGEQVNSLLVVDRNFNLLGATPISMCRYDRGEDVEQPAHCSQ